MMNKQLGDYGPDLLRRVEPPTGNDGTVPRGPLMSPVKLPACGAPPQKNPQDALNDINARVACLERSARKNELMWDQVTDHLLANFPAPGSRGFVVPGQVEDLAQVGSAGGVYTAIVTVNFAKGWDGYVKFFQLGSDPEGDGQNITWQLRLNNAPQPNFSGNIFTSACGCTLYPIHLQITQGTRVELWAINNGSGPITVRGMLLGWQTPARRF